MHQVPDSALTAEATAPYYFNLYNGIRLLVNVIDKCSEGGRNAKHQNWSHSWIHMFCRRWIGITLLRRWRSLNLQYAFGLKRYLGYELTLKKWVLRNKIQKRKRSRDLLLDLICCWLTQ